MFDNNSDYALNKKDKDSIVYKGCDGYEQRISREQFATEEEFLFWKSWSDEDYRETDYKDAYCSTIIFVEIKTNGRCSISKSDTTRRGFLSPAHSCDFETLMEVQHEIC